MPDIELPNTVRVMHDAGGMYVPLPTVGVVLIDPATSEPYRVPEANDSKSVSVKQITASVEDV